MNSNLFEKKFPTYSLNERDRRWNLARRLMEQEQLDALVVYGDREGSFPAPFVQIVILPMTGRAQ